MYFEEIACYTITCLIAVLCNEMCHVRFCGMFTHIHVDVPFSVVTCGFLEAPGNGSKNGSSPLAGSVITFSCNDGFILGGSAQRTCTEAGTWDGVETTCIGEFIYFSCTCGGHS